MNATRRIPALKMRGFPVASFGNPLDGATARAMDLHGGLGGGAQGATGPAGCSASAERGGDGVRD